ncbi:doublesex cognate 73A [Haematobia irritans]|uniref:doublesex cognate 73A n=1 Tax=Haematobia irritans TaxID=7368 RepID=UPI003F5083B2
MGYQKLLQSFLLLIVFNSALTYEQNYPGVIELVGYSNRRARNYYQPTEEHSVASAADPKLQADIETVRQNIEKYNKLLTLDTKNLPESQKDMLERIVERVARLKETLDINEKLLQANASVTQSTDKYSTSDGEEENSTLIPSDVTDAFNPTNDGQKTDEGEEDEGKTEPTLVLDETTLLQLRNSMDKLAAAQMATITTSQTSKQLNEFPTTTEMNAAETMTSLEEKTESLNSLPTESEEYDITTLEPSTDTTDAQEEFVAARSNNVGITAAADDTETMATLTTTIGSQRTLTTSGKIRTRATKRPTSTKGSGSKRRPSTSSAANSNNKGTSSKHKISHSPAAVTTQPSSSSAYPKVGHKPIAQAAVQQSYQQPAPVKTLASLSSSSSSSAAASSSDKYASSASTPVAVPSSTSYASINPVNNMASLTSSTSSLPAATYGSLASNNQDLAYDAHVNTSAIIDSLSNNGREEFYQQQQQANQQLQKQGLQSGLVTKDKKPISGAKPTKYHYYPHNQHIYLLPECAIQQVCNAVYVRLNYTQPLCACPSRYRDPCSASLNEDDQHTTKLVGDGKKKAITLAKTCEATTEMRECRSPKDWSLLALQNTRTGKSHYLVICRCPDHFKMEGPMAHDQPTYASVPGIRVFGMMCVKPGYSVRKPSAQPPKRYQLQKPFYRPSSQTTYGQQSNSNLGSTSSQQYGGSKDNYGRPSYGGISSTSSASQSSLAGFNSATSSNYHGSDSFGSQSNYQYLNRPESIGSTSGFNNNKQNYRPEPVSINNFPGGSYGRNNERDGTDNIEAATEIDNKLLINTSTQASEEAKTTLSEETTNVTEELKREKRSLHENTVDGDGDGDMPEFPWDRVIEFEKTLVWD